MNRSETDTYEATKGDSKVDVKVQLDRKIKKMRISDYFQSGPKLIKFNTNNPLPK